MLDCLLQRASICSFQPPLRFVGKSWSSDCFSGFITQLRASPRGDGQKAFYRSIKLMVVFVIPFLT